MRSCFIEVPVSVIEDTRFCLYEMSWLFASMSGWVFRIWISRSRPCSISPSDLIWSIVLRLNSMFWIALPSPKPCSA